MTVERGIKISPSGEVLGLHIDGLFDGLDGELQMVRASSVEFCNTTKKWYVFIHWPDGGREKLPKGFDRRNEAIDTEVDVLSALLMQDSDFSVSVGNMFTKPWSG